MIADMTLSQLALTYGGTLFHPDCHFTQVSTDTRTLQPGDLFVALSGEQYDAHEFLSEAAKKACGLVLERPDRALNIPQWVVPDTTSALGDIAHSSRKLFDGQMIAVTGSSGKTTVKEMLAAILKLCGPTLFTKGNLNNHIGVPLTLLELNKKHKYAVVEMGASGKGEIAYLTDIARPDIAVVNNVMPAHIGGFGSLDAIAETKGAVYKDLAPSGTAVINIDELWAKKWRETLPCSNCISFSMSDDKADFYIQDHISVHDQTSRFVLHTPIGVVDIYLQIPGKHNVANSLAAAACAFAAGASLKNIAQGLESVRTIKGRMQMHRSRIGAAVLDDTYNANPGSVKAAIDMLSEYSGKRILVLGEMGELGELAPTLHREVGEYAYNKGIDSLWAMGSHATAIALGFGKTAHVCTEKKQLVDEILETLKDTDTVLVKGSRSAAMEEVVNLITEGEK